MSGVRTKLLFTVLFIIVPLGVLLSVWAVAIRSTPAVQTQDCNFASEGQCAATLILHGGDQVSGKISYENVTGTGTMIWVTSPSGQVVYNSSALNEGFGFQFSAVVPGAYVLHLDGPFHSANDPIAVDYVASGIDCY